MNYIPEEHTPRPLVFAKAKAQEDGYCWLEISERLGVMIKSLKRPGKGGRRIRIQTAYFGFDSPQAAHKFESWLNKSYRPAKRSAVREAKRLDSQWEVKVWECLGLHDLVIECAVKDARAAASKAA